MRAEPLSRNRRKLTLVSSLGFIAIIVTWLIYDCATRQEEPKLWYITYGLLSVNFIVRAWQNRDAFRS